MSAESGSDNRSIRLWLLISTFSFLLVFALIVTVVNIQIIELLAYDQLLASRSGSHLRTPIHLVTYTDDDLDKLKHSSIPDALLATLLEKLIVQKPRVIGIDIYRPTPLPPDTQKLAKIVNSNPHIVMAHKYGDHVSPGVKPFPLLKNSEQSGCTDIPKDIDGKTRRALIYLGDPACYSFGFQIAMQYLAFNGIEALGEKDDPSSLRLRDSRLPRLWNSDGGYRNLDNKGYQILMAFRNLSKPVSTYSIFDVLEGRVEPSQFKDSIVLIGSVAESSKDFFSIPCVSEFLNCQKLPGVILHALFIDQLASAAIEGNREFRFLPDWLEWLIVGAFCFLGAAITLRNATIPFFIPIQAIGFLTIASIAYCSFMVGFWLPVVPTTLGWLLSTMLTAAWLAYLEHRQRYVLMNLFARHVSSPIAGQIWQNRHAILSGQAIIPQRMTATVFFSDICGFTAIAENLEPEVFVAWLNEYLDAMTLLVEEHGGVVIRFIGDAIMAGFGVPIPRNSETPIKTDAANAARCALAMQDKLIELNKKWHSVNLPVVKMRIGINTGELLAGSLGNKDRLEYTIQGDTVNIAARLENFEKEKMNTNFYQNPCRILITKETEQYLDSIFNRKSLGTVPLKGKNKLVEIFYLGS